VYKYVVVSTIIEAGFMLIS